MKARTQSAIIAANVVVAPLVVLLIGLALQGIKEKKMDLYINIAAREVKESLKRGELPSSTEIESLQKMQHFRLILITPAQKVAYSSVPGIAVGESISEVLSFLHRKENYGYEFVLVTDSRKDDLDFRDYTVIIRNEKKIGGYIFTNTPVDYFIFSMIAIMLISISVTISILHKITTSITCLDESTRNISFVDLDKPVDIRGSDEIDSLVHSFNSMRSTIKQIVVRRNNFVMGISHDFKTPLALIRGYAEILEDSLQSITEKQEEYIASIGIKVEQLEAMLDDLIEFISIDASSQSSYHEKIEFGDWMKKYVERCVSDAALLGKKIESEISIPSGSFVRMDERLIERAFDNLVHNAFRYTAAGGIVRIEASESEKGIAVRFIDNGPGIDKKDSPFIFDMFYRGTPSRQTDGMGLGLSVVKNIVDIHEWNIDVFSEPPDGTTFQILIPESFSHLAISASAR